MEFAAPKVPVEVSKKYSFTGIIFLIVLIAVVLYFGRSLFIPLSFALFISCVLYPICEWLERKGVNKSVAILIAETGLFILIGVIVYLLFTQFTQFAAEWEPLKSK